MYYERQSISKIFLYLYILAYSENGVYILNILIDVRFAIYLLVFSFFLVFS